MFFASVCVNMLTDTAPANQQACQEPAACSRGVANPAGIPVPVYTARPRAVQLALEHGGEGVSLESKATGKFHCQNAIHNQGGGETEPPDRGAMNLCAAVFTSFASLIFLVSRRTQYARLFRQIDTNGDAEISQIEFIKALRRYRFCLIQDEISAASTFGLTILGHLCNHQRQPAGKEAQLASSHSARG